MREANRAKAQAQQDAQRKAGLNVTGRQNTRDDQATTQPRDSRTRDDDRER
jgi:non-canonical (house-cleaning) NTP pyrophosphatase